ncbi:MAG: UDP-N-acetylglucosamine--N-acetylmuramyl-(pentapeptide) pyrophosphoryl-undecaprenol N-acetylglucosamine transferase [Opitutus sp.]
MSLFLISCGGTGGHLSPGISLAEGLTARGHDCRLLISQKKVDARLSEKYPKLHFERMPGSGLSFHPVRLGKFVLSQAHALLFCLRLLRQARPDAIVGFGGFTSAPLVLAAWVLDVPAVLHECNRVPGRAIRMLGRFATRVYLPPGIRISSIRASATRHAGLPVRREIRRSPPASARAALGLDPNRRTLVLLGGSQGASSLNDWMRANLDVFAAEGIQVYCVTGLGKGREGVVGLKTRAGEPIQAIFTPFSDRMAELMSAADLVISRAGAGTLAELIRCETPAILVPYPRAADDHQRANAEYFERQGGGVVVRQQRVGGMAAEVLDIIFNDWLLRRFRSNLQRMDRANSLDLMLGDIEQIARCQRSDSCREPVTA